MLRKLLVLPLALALFAAACGSDDTEANGSTDTGDATGNGTTLQVSAFDFGFEPATISLDAGEEITLDFDNTGDAPHTFTSEDLDVDIRTSAGGGGTQTFTAPEDGTYSFRCTIHPDRMTGEVIVGTGGPGAGGGGMEEGPAENDDGLDY